MFPYIFEAHSDNGDKNLMTEGLGFIVPVLRIHTIFHDPIFKIAVPNPAASRTLPTRD